MSPLTNADPQLVPYRFRERVRRAVPRVNSGAREPCCSSLSAGCFRGELLPTYLRTVFELRRDGGLGIVVPHRLRVAANGLTQPASQPANQPAQVVGMRMLAHSATAAAIIPNRLLLYHYINCE